MKVKATIISLMMLLAAVTVEAQIVISGNVYGGARQADVKGSALVNIGADNFDVLINTVYGGNDIAGTIGTSETLPTAITDASANGIDKTYNAFVRISPERTETTGEGEQAVTTQLHHIFIGSLYGGSNGAYEYTKRNDGKYDVDVNGETTESVDKPEIDKTYLEIKGGTIAYLYGGGNSVTVKNTTFIYINNGSEVTTEIKDAKGNNMLADKNLLAQMGIAALGDNATRDTYHFSRVFGGNNKAEMAIRPTWKLEKGNIDNLYSGGNEGPMTWKEGLLLEIQPTNSDDLMINNVYGGCRKADVHPLRSGSLEEGNGVDAEDDEIQIHDANGNVDARYAFPAGLSARVIVYKGDINNVYGGNDIAGKVYGGNAVGIRSSIRGDVYGGGNGSYAYTDNPNLKNTLLFGDYYYEVPNGKSSVEALNDFRPNAESVSIRVTGDDADHPTIIGGAIYCGGNSATLRNDHPDKDAAAELKIGSHVIADKVFLGNNGENMIKEAVLEQYAKNVDEDGNVVDSGGEDYSQMNLASTEKINGKTQFEIYMDGVTMNVKPRVVFDPSGYEAYSTKFGSFFCGGNVGSMKIDGASTINFNDKVIIFEKLVGGSNDANVYASDYNTEYLGGLLGNPASNGDKLILNFGGLKIQPMRWKMNDDGDDYARDQYGNRILEWNTFIGDDKDNITANAPLGNATADDRNRRFKGGNIYGGCYNTGHVNGNVVLNINASLVDRKGDDSVFDEIEINEGEAILYNNETYTFTKRHSGVILDEQGMDPLGRGLNVFGGGYGTESEIWGSSTINLNAGYTFQVFGGGEKGAIGRGTYNTTTKKLEYNTYDPKYSCYVNLRGADEGVYRGHADDKDDMAEVEFIYGGSFEAPIAGDVVINLGNGRIFNSFAGSCNADILGHTETYVGRQKVLSTDGTYTYVDAGGFPWIRDHIYGGNDLGGHILGKKNFISRVNADIRNKVYNPKKKTQPDVTSASAYIEYQQGRLVYIFGGCYGYYNYKDRHYKDYTNENGIATGNFVKPRMDNAFVNFRPFNNTRNEVEKIYGAGQGYSGDSDRDIMQDRSYILIDIPQNITKFQNMEVFGAGDYSGVGMRNEAEKTISGITVSALNKDITRANADGVTGAAVIDLLRGQVKDVFGASYKEGVTRRTIINVPAGSTIQSNRIFGGAYGVSNEKPCDVIESNINFDSDVALVGGYRTGIFGGNNNYRRTLYSFVNINSPVFYDKENDYVATVFGGGYGENTWSEYTQVNLNNTARLYEAYGGGYGGMVLNEQSVKAFNSYSYETGEGDDKQTVTKTIDKTLGAGYENLYLNDPLVKTNKLGIKCNTNVNINEGADISGYLYKGSISGGYCYAGGYGKGATVSGSTYIGLHGGSVFKDLYAGGTSGAVMDLFKLKTFTATTNAYIEGGTARNVYGGGWEGNVGYTKMATTVVDGKNNITIEENIPGKTNVVIGIRQDQASLPEGYGYLKGVPAIQRNAYGGGEGGAVFGNTNLTLNNGYIGYTYNGETGEYEEKLHDETWSDHVGKDRLSDCGNLFGGGYDDNSSVDSTNVVVWGGLVRNSVFGGGEIATIGRGKTKESGEDNKDRELEAIYKSGKTHIEMFNGHVKRNIFGGGKGYNILGYGGVHGFYTDGYVFGQTEVHVHGGEIGTEEGLANGDGNVFGGGDIGYVYGPGVKSAGTLAKENTGSPNHIYYKDDDGHLTEDCKVVIAPMLQLKPGNTVTFDSKTYNAYDYVPTEYLNTLPADKTDSRWRALFTGDKKPNGNIYEDDPVERGVHIRNAVFAGGNVSSNSESYNNATTVFGNSTATLYDVFHRDFITVGTEHTGGLYGGGNLSMVNGYRELNITNYGTDYYGMDDQISLAKYQTLTNRERAYFKLEYQFQLEELEINGTTYKKNDRISEDEYDALPSQYKTTYYWIQYGFCSIYAGRLLNTIQRADFCGVFGSRLVLQGAKDRVADVGDATEYTINRVGEVSLNQQRFIKDSDDEIHGNYFGIYSIVNYLGNLTSDVRFYSDNRRYVDKGKTYTSNQTYHDWKEEHLAKRDRNNGTSYNQVALASGVYLELTSENSTTSNKIYGDITGVVELDLINVKKDIEGGGYVYARNEHGSWEEVSHENTLLSPYNMKDGDEALTKKIYRYSSTDLKPYQTSGNFIHKSKRIVDDCYPNNGVYNDSYVKSPAHYWFIKGEVYIYDQVVSAYAGSAAAYSREVKIPLTISAGSYGQLKLLNIQPSRYAYFSDEQQNIRMTKDGVKVDNESMTYHLNDVITWWDWNQLSDNEQKYFVKETYVNVDTCYVGDVLYPAGTYVLENDPSVHGGNAEATAYKTFIANPPAIYDKNKKEITNVNTLFHPSNNIGHDTGYVLTLDMNSPKDWDDWYSPIKTADGTKIPKETYGEKSTADKAKYREGPTYVLTGSTGLYGQREYTAGDVISKEVYDDYESTVSLMNPRPTEGQATAEPAYVALADEGNMQAGGAISETVYNGLSDKSNYAAALLCINTIQLGKEDYVLMGELVSETNLSTLAARYKKFCEESTNLDEVTDEQALAYVTSHLSPAYYITSDGYYGGQYYQKGENYSAIKSWCALPDARNNFGYNYDALDVLVDPTYPGEGHIDVYAHPYDEIKSVEYNAAYMGEGTLTYYDNDNTMHTISNGGTINREKYEKVKNEQLHYTRLSIDKKGADTSDTQTIYVVTDNIINNGTPYAKGQDISEKDYKALTALNKQKVDVLTFPKGDKATIVYYCYESYTPTSTFTVQSGTAGEKGSVISEDTYSTDIPNYQKQFTIQGSEPTETTTLYVSRESNPKDVTSEKVISVVYQYTYYEADEEGDGVSLVNELHVVNIHLQLESGAPEIGPLNEPPAVLPGKTLGMKAPSLNPGLYEPIVNGWEIFESEEDAMLHRNGKPFTMLSTPLYWYQNRKVFLAFYSKTYLGKTYSNYVPLTVANYHDIDAIMKDKEHHLYVDHPDVDRNSKIYIDNRDCESDATKSELDLLKDFFDLSVLSSLPAEGTTLAGHALLDSHVKAGADLEFILNSDVSPKAYTVSGGSLTGWTPIGDATNCFAGNFHGDGYTVSGLDHSLFGNLCGKVYNLGVTGSFTSAGVADTGAGYVENCWINTSASSGFPAGVKAVFGNPSDASSKQVVNCYYPNTKTYAAGDAHPMTETQFYNGTVAFNLNGFYLNKRYYDHNVPSGSPVEYRYLKNENGTLSETPLTGYYPAEPDAQYGDVGYVESRYNDGDFIYSEGTIPEVIDDRMRVLDDGTTTTVTHSPIWPDDYIFFGQILTYDYNSTRPHNDMPTHVVKESGRLPISNSSNRVYRAPAYYQSKDMGFAHFNLWANIAAHSKPKSPTDDTMKPVYPNMTAIDFFGHNDNTWALGISSGFPAGAFYPPLLDDDDGLLGIDNNYETPNLLVYAPVKGNDKTDNALAEKFEEPKFDDYYSNDKYRQVATAPTSSVHGHVVQSNLKATNDHLLVDKRDFNCPIAYSFADGYRMWYQRTPDRYVNTNQGWEAVSLPFTAELVTTHQKGEITHFYSGSRSVDENGTKVGHEYWLREFKDKKAVINETETVVAIFNYPESASTDKTKTVENSFLWDYYYSANDRHDANTDIYQTYYQTARELSAYPLLANATPYIIGFPGKTFYEFDLSGEWTAKNTAGTAPAQLNKQIITFASYPSNTDGFSVVSIGISDDESGTTKGSYTFKPNYSSKAIEGYLLNAVGNDFTATTAATAAVPFRPYFVASGGSSPAPVRRGIQHIVFDDDNSSFAIGDEDPDEGIGQGGLLFSVRNHAIVVTSSLRKAADVRIVNVNGQTIAAFDIQPGESIETPVRSSGVYIIRAAGGHYTKKIAVK